MKRTVLPLIALVSMLIFSCKQDSIMPKLGKIQTESLRTLSFRGVTRVSNTRGFTIDASYDGSNDQNKGGIDFSKENWGTNPPKVILFVKNTNDNSIIWAKQLGEGEYWYNGGEKPSISFKTNIEYSPSIVNNEKLFLYVFDSSLDCTCEKSTDGYNVKIDFPSLTKNSDNTYTLSPADKQDQKIIFSTSVVLQKILDDTDPKSQTKLDDVTPIGTLILFSLKNTSTNKEYKVDNNYLLRFKTNGFSFENVKIDCATGDVSHAAIYNYTESDDRNSYSKDTQGNIDYNNVLEDAPKLDYTDIKLVSPTSTDVTLGANARSAIYALYVMPTTNNTIDGYGTKYNMLKVSHPYTIKSSEDDPEPENVEAYLFNSHNLIDFYSMGGKSVSLTINVPGVVAGDIRYNALAYSGYYNIAADKQSFNKEQLNNTLEHNYDAMLQYDDALKLFTPLPEFLKGYHMPTVGDWNSILLHNNGNFVYFDKLVDSEYHSGDSPKDIFTVGGVSFDNVTSYYKNKDGNGVAYAIRFTTIHRIEDDKTLSKGNCPYLSVWRYAYIDNPKGGMMLEIYCYVLPKNYKFNTSGDLTIDDGYNGPQSITNKDFFKNRLGAGAVHRLYPATGCTKGNILSWSEGQGYYWTSTPDPTKYDDGNPRSYDVYFGPHHAHSNADLSKGFGYAVRPFFDVPRY